MAMATLIKFKPDEHVFVNYLWPREPGCAPTAGKKPQREKEAPSAPQTDRTDECDTNQPH